MLVLASLVAFVATRALLAFVDEYRRNEVANPALYNVVYGQLEYALTTIAAQGTMFQISVKGAFLTDLTFCREFCGLHSTTFVPPRNVCLAFGDCCSSSCLLRCTDVTLNGP